jgi:hypothetical protein
MKNQKMNLVRTLVALFAVAAIGLAGTACSGDDKKEESAESTGDQKQGGDQDTQGGTQGSGDNGNAGGTAGGATGEVAGAAGTATAGKDKVATPTAPDVAAPTAASALLEGAPPKGARPEPEAVAVPATAAPGAAAAAAVLVSSSAVAPVAAAPAISAAGGAHLGEWIMDLEALLSMPEAKEMPAEQKEMMKSMMGSMSFKFTEEKFIMNAMGKTQEVGYSITKKDGDNMTIMMAPESGGGGEAQMTVAGNKLTLTKPGQKQPMVLKRK